MPKKILSNCCPNKYYLIVCNVAPHLQGCGLSDNGRVNRVRIDCGRLMHGAPRCSREEPNTSRAIVGGDRVCNNLRLPLADTVASHHIE
jgi:hypothetical protein